MSSLEPSDTNAQPAPARVGDFIQRNLNDSADAFLQAFANYSPEESPAEKENRRRRLLSCRGVRMNLYDVAEQAGLPPEEMRRHLNELHQLALTHITWLDPSKGEGARP